LTFFYGELPVEVSLSRDATTALRIVKARLQERDVSLDFTTEPGVVTSDGVALPDERWDASPQPLLAEWLTFLEEVHEPSRQWAQLAHHTKHIVEGTQGAMRAVRQHEKQRARLHLLHPRTEPLPPSLSSALRNQLGEALLREELIANPRDEDGLDLWVNRAWTVIHHLSDQPFTTQRELAEVVGTDRDDLRRLNAALRRCDWAQDLILRDGAGAKYWMNTILPLTRSGAVASTLAGRSTYPFRVGIYPGPSCMFSCTFCGRNYDASYDRDSVPKGNMKFRTIFETSPANDPYTYYISGGLEPLTNPGIGELVSCGAQHGYRLSMYTNGMMLTPRLLEKQQGLWDLSTLRISLYGVDEESTRNVTRKSHAFDRVIKNATDFLRLRNIRSSSTSFGFNFVLLPGLTHQLLQVLEIIAQLNRETDGRQVDFLTVREDYSARGPDAIGPEERAALLETLRRAQERCARTDLSDLQVDYGYALEAIDRGHVGRPLEMVDEEHIREQGYPQISVVIDLLGDVYLYREAGFLDRPGADHYIIGRVDETRSLDRVVADFVASGRRIPARLGDTQYFDAFDHVVTLLLNQAEDDRSFGIPFEQGPVPARSPIDSQMDAAPTIGALAHPTLAHPTLVEV
jgi:dTDP-4-amino-4,6-dideoxy-D-glucose ammonia-lyase